MKKIKLKVKTNVKVGPVRRPIGVGPVALYGIDPVALYGIWTGSWKD